jgi:hypothetical protein
MYDLFIERHGEDEDRPIPKQKSRSPHKLLKQHDKSNRYLPKK